MGDMADDMRDAEMEWHFQEFFGRGRQQMVKRMQLRRLKSIQVGWWRTRQDVEIEISKLDDTHLANIIAMLTRNELTSSSKFKELTDEQAKRTR